MRQSQEIGDGTGLVIALAGQLLLEAENLIYTGVHPSDIISGYKKATEKAYSICDETVCHTVEDLVNKAELIKAVSSTFEAKQSGLTDFFVPLIVDACLQIAPPGKNYFNVDNVRVNRILGGSSMDSKIVNGVVFTRDTEGIIKSVKDAKVIIYTCEVEATSTETKGTVLIESANELMNYNKSEEDAMEKIILDIKATGANVLISGSKFSEMAVHFCDRHGIMAIKCLSKFELRRIANVVNATMLPKLISPTADDMGTCDEISIEELGQSKLCIFRQNNEDSAVSTILLRGATTNFLEDMTRAVENCVNAVRAIMRDGRLLPGAGATEIELAKQIGEYGDQTPGMDQYSIKKFAEALEIVPRTLGENAAARTTDLLSALYVAHGDGKKNVGVDIQAGGVIDVKEAGILDLLIVKKLAIKLASEAALTVLGVDQIIMAKPAGGPKPPKQGGSPNPEN